MKYGDGRILFKCSVAALLVLQACSGLVYAADGDREAVDSTNVQPRVIDGSPDPAETTPHPTISQAIAGKGRNDPFDDSGFLKSVPLSGTDWRFSFGGYAKVDLIFDNAGTGDKKQFTVATIPVDGDPPPGSYTNLSASETRFNFEVRNLGSPYSNDRFFLEMEFFEAKYGI